MSWAMRYAPHLGLLSPALPMFIASAGADPVDQIRFVADQGFAGIEDNYLALRPVEDQARIGAALRQAGLAMGCFVMNPESWNQPLWGSADPAAQNRLKADLERALAVAERVGGRLVTTVTGQDPLVPAAIQFANMIDNLKRLAPLAEKAGIVLALESTNERRFPGQLLHHIADADLVVRAVDSPAVRLCFDIGHIHPMDGEILPALDACWDRIAAIQVADMPNRLELGTGELNWPNILRRIRDRGFAGLIELEHEISEPGAAGEARILDRLRAVDSAI